MVPAYLERELKLTAPRYFDLRAFTASLEGFTRSPVRANRLSTVYYDTDDLRLAAVGVSLRYRRGEGWTLKLPVADQSILTRAEHVYRGSPFRPPDQIADLIAAAVRHKPLERIAELRTLRQRVRLGDARGELVELVVDDVRVMRDATCVEEFVQAEIELVGEADAALMRDLERRLRELGAGDKDPLTKYEHVLGALGREPETAPDDDIDGFGIVRNALAASLRDLIEADPHVRLDDDPEWLHQMRVSVRRLRSDLRTFAHIIGDEDAAAMRARLRWLARTLGFVRDADVLLERMRELGKLLAPEDAAAVERLGGTVKANRGAAHRRLLGVLRDGTYLDLLDALAALCRRPSLGDHPRQEILAAVEQQWRKLAKAAKTLDATAPDPALHALRIKAKRCRYAADVAAAVGGRAARRFSARVARLQTVLGVVHDSALHAAEMRALPHEPEEAFVLGELCGLTRSEETDARRRWRSAWEELESRDLHFWRA